MGMVRPSDTAPNADLVAPFTAFGNTLTLVPVT